MEDLSVKVENHEKRIGKLEVKEAVTKSKLDTTNKILGAIALMVGAALINYFFKLL